VISGKTEHGMSVQFYNSEWLVRWRVTGETVIVGVNKRVNDKDSK